MSKTYRRTPHEDVSGFPRYERRSPQPDEITPEWAVGAMGKHIRLWLNRAIMMELFCEAERDEYRGILENAARRAAELYRPGVCNEEGRVSSPTHYVRTAVDNRTRSITKQILDFRRKYPAVPIVSDPPTEATQKGCISFEDVRLSDQCRSVRELIFRMDVATLFGKLPSLCARFLRYRLGGLTKEEASERLGISLYMVRKEVIPRIREVAIACGFEPRSAVEGERPWRKKNEEFSHDSPGSEV